MSGGNLVSRKQIADRWGINLSLVGTLVTKGILPLGHKIKGIFYWTEDEVNAAYSGCQEYINAKVHGRTYAKTRRPRSK